MEKQFKTLEFIYQDIQIHFLVNPNNNNVMVNATEMAKAFDKRIDFFLKTEHVAKFIDAFEYENIDGEFPPNGGNSFEEKRKFLIHTRGQLGTYFHKILAYKFAAWLDPKFEVWVYTQIDKIVFGNYKKHWEAHQRQENAKLKLAILKEKFLKENPELAVEYFETEKIVNETRSEKQKALQNQYKMDLFKE